MRQSSLVSYYQARKVIIVFCDTYCELPKTVKRSCNILSLLFMVRSVCGIKMSILLTTLRMTNNLFCVLIQVDYLQCLFTMLMERFSLRKTNNLPQSIAMHRRHVLKVTSNKYTIYVMWVVYHHYHKQHNSCIKHFKKLQIAYTKGTIVCVWLIVLPTILENKTKMEYAKVHWGVFYLIYLIFEARLASSIRK